jgi:hypothetical protein
MSDATGASVASLLLFEVGTTKTFDCTVAWGVRTTSEQIAAELEAGNLATASASGVQRQTSADVQRDLLAILSRGEDARAAADRFLDALSVEPNGTAGTSQEARSLVRNLTGLLAEAALLDPDKPRYESATGLTAVVYSFNEYVEASDDAFLADAPDALLAIETVLSRLVVSAIENEDRIADEASRRGDYGLICAPPPPPAAPPPTASHPVMPPPPPLERVIEVCVIEDDRIRFVPAIFRPEIGDTVAVRQGLRVSFSSVHPDVSAAELAWVTRGEAVRLGLASYIPSGQPFTVSPADDLSAAGEFMGVPLFTRKAAGSPPDVLFVPLAPRCLVQPYRLQEDVRKVR